jgi:DNA-binding NarL/FixJ family response regulator
VSAPAACRHCHHTPTSVDLLSGRERDVLAVMAEGRSNHGIASTLWICEGTVEKHVRSILTKLGIADVVDDHRRVLAVLAWLRHQAETATGDLEVGS